MALNKNLVSIFYITIFMAFYLEAFFKAMEGNWTTKTTIYTPRDKKIFNYQENIAYRNNTIHDLNNQINSSIITSNKDIELNIWCINKWINKDYQNYYEGTIINNTLIKIQIFKYNMYYVENIYDISTNFKISIAILKYSTNYIAIIFTSYIKKIT